LILRTICSSGTRWISGTGSFLYTSQTVRAGQDIDPEDHLFQWHTLDLWHWIIPIHITHRQWEQGRILIRSTICSSGTRWISGTGIPAHKRSLNRV
jgi:hypothetical protein